MDYPVLIPLVCIERNTCVNAVAKCFRHCRGLLLQSTNSIALITLIPILPLLGFLFIALSGKRLVHGFASLVACGSVFASFGFSLALFIKLLSGAESFQFDLFNWISAGSFNATLGFLIDPLASLMLLIITGVGFLIHVYSIGYMHDDEGFNRFFSYLNLFVFFMLLLVMGNNYLLMFVGW